MYCSIYIHIRALSALTTNDDLVGAVMNGIRNKSRDFMKVGRDRFEEQGG